ncbi:ATP-binding cassette subfamily B protein [Motilibacter rhizosphaerae]|uniref:ATP-binding cassette subfamily B protein n=1 Tax=Motilibacter rhizosphaerae TaxID=598652 RepID=A0A4Q7NYI7_9ACTN|nr:ABC transporter ATP-binding protein [Motilibacter rhizosphaerae]RZS91462.1 ATP-binding cassette subfamily B protein [Motilibacter rhizosphaerae]
MTSGTIPAEVFSPEHPVQTARRLYRGQRRHLLLATVAFACKHSPVWVMPLLTANTIDAVVEERPLRVLWVDVGVMVLLVLQNMPLTQVYARELSLALRTVETELRITLCQRLQELSIGYHRRMSAGVLQAKVVRDVENVVESSRQVFDSALAALMTLAGALVLTGLEVPAFLPVFAVAVPAAAALVTAMRRRLHLRNEAFRHQIEQLSARVSEMTHLIPVTRAHALEGSELERMGSTLRDVREQGVELDVVNGRFSALAWALFQLLSVLCLASAAFAARLHALSVTPGDVVLLSSYFVALTGSVTMLMGLAPQLARGLESVRSMSEVLTEPDVERNEGKAEVREVRGRLVFERVGFAYPGSAGPALDAVDLDVAPGETVALVGPSGSGKSTMLGVVIGFLQPTTGRVLLDGRDMQELDLRTYRRHLAVVPQESLLLAGTVRDNVGYGQPELRDRDLQEALEAANAWEFVRAAGGLDARIGERGGQLSGGQKQRLAIARALVRDPRVLVLDEATSALDPESEALVQEALARLVAGRTTFVVAHRLSTVRGADRIAVMREGRIVEVGSHAALLAAAGAYAGLVDLAGSGTSVT